MCIHIYIYIYVCIEGPVRHVPARRAAPLPLPALHRPDPRRRPAFGEPPKGLAIR